MVYGLRAVGLLELNYKSALGNKKLKEIKKQIDQGMEQLDEDFNLKYMIK